MSENDNAELQCICSATNANTLIPTCEACVTQFDVDTDDDDLVNDNGKLLARPRLGKVVLTPHRRP